VFLWPHAAHKLTSVKSRTSILSSSGDGLLSCPYSRLGATLMKEYSDSAMQGSCGMAVARGLGGLEAPAMTQENGGQGSC
jgi:hypothetical protein